MNGWDAFTWFNAVVLVVVTSLIFIFFLRDAGKVLKQEEGRKKE
jgi:hypothetical protein